jgi:hypothetical protein
MKCRKRSCTNEGHPVLDNCCSIDCSEICELQKEVDRLTFIVNKNNKSETEVIPIWSETRQELIYDCTTIQSILSDKKQAQELECYWCKKVYPPVPDLDLLVSDFLSYTALVDAGHKLGPIPDLSGVQTLLEWTMKNSDCFAWVPDFRKPV